MSYVLSHSHFPDFLPASCALDSLLFRVSLLFLVPSSHFLSFFCLFASLFPMRLPFCFPCSLKVASLYSLPHIPSLYSFVNVNFLSGGWRGFPNPFQSIVGVRCPRRYFRINRIPFQTVFHDDFLLPQRHLAHSRQTTVSIVHLVVSF